MNHFEPIDEAIDALTPPATPAPQARRLALLHQVREQMRRRAEFWVFAYGSLIWKPAFEPAEHRIARVWGHHRALQMHSRLDRGTAQRPGLVFALLPGGSCQGLVQRVHRADDEAILELLWSREMDSGVYRPCWLNCQTTHGPVHALSFTLSRRSPSHAGELSDAQLLDILRHAHGRYGRTLDYLLHTAQALQGLGIRDAHVQRLVALVHRHRLLDSDLPHNTTPVRRPQAPLASAD